jgi:hypothetical protein
MRYGYATGRDDLEPNTTSLARWDWQNIFANKCRALKQLVCYATCFAEGAVSVISTEYHVIVALLYATVNKASNHLKGNGEQISALHTAVAVPWACQLSWLPCMSKLLSV